jgi:hypothetical protein
MYSYLNSFRSEQRNERVSFATRQRGYAAKLVRLEAAAEQPQRRGQGQFKYPMPSDLMVRYATGLAAIGLKSKNSRTEYGVIARTAYGAC